YGCRYLSGAADGNDVPCRYHRWLAGTRHTNRPRQWSARLLQGLGQSGIIRRHQSMNSKPFPIARARGTREAFTLKQRGRCSGFTLAELLVSVFVLALIILMVAQLTNSAAALTKMGHKHISADTQARTVFD